MVGSDSVKTFGRRAAAGLWFLAAGTAAAAVPAAPHMDSDLVAGGGGLMQMVFGLAAVLALIVALAWAVRRFGRVQPLPAGALRVLGGLSLGARERLVLVKVGEAQLLLGVAPGRVQTLHVLAEPIERAAPVEPGAGARDFAERLRAVLRPEQS